MLITTHSSATLAILLGTVAWGTVPAIQKWRYKTRFEAFTVDFVIAEFLCIVVYCLIFHPKHIIPTSPSTSTVAVASAFLGGVNMSFANFLLFGGIRLAGSAVAVPVAMTCGIVGGIFFNYTIVPKGNIFYLVFATCLLIIAVFLNAVVPTDRFAEWGEKYIDTIPLRVFGIGQKKAKLNDQESLFLGLGQVSSPSQISSPSFSAFSQDDPETLPLRSSISSLRLSYSSISTSSSTDPELGVEPLEGQPQELTSIVNSHVPAGVTLSFVGGALTALFSPMATMAIVSEKTNPVSTLFYFGCGELIGIILLSYTSCHVDLFGRGKAFSLFDHVIGTRRRDHFWAIVSGSIHSVGLLTNFLVLHIVSPAAVFGIQMCSSVFVIYWSVFVFDELKFMNGVQKAFVLLVVVLFCGAILMFLASEL